MNISYFISKRIVNAEKKSFSATIHLVGVASIALGLATMIISFLILVGFQNTIKEKDQQLQQKEELIIELSF